MISTEVLTSLISLIVAAATGSWALFKVIIPKLVESRISLSEAQTKERIKQLEYERSREEFRENKLFDLFEQSIQKLGESVTTMEMNHKNVVNRLDRIEQIYRQQNGILSELLDRLRREDS